LKQTELQFIEDKAGKTCPVCGKDVVGPAHKVYCSKRCSDSAWREANSERRKELNKKWKKANPEKVRAQKKRHYEANTEKVKAQAEKWRKANPEKVREGKRKYRKSNPEKVREGKRKCYKANPEVYKKSVKKWQKANPEKCKAYGHQRRARLKGNGIEDTSEFRARMTHPLVRQVCFYCGKDCTSSGDWHWDHRIPISAGGPDAEWNLVIACPPCNLKKGSKYPKTLFAEEIFNEP